MIQSQGLCECKHDISLTLFYNNNKMVEVYESMFNRSVEEFNKSHIDNALNVPYMFITEEGKFVSFLFIILLIHFCFIRQPKPKTKRDYD